MYVHAPDKLKRKIKEYFWLRYENFLRHTESICEIKQQRVIEQAKKFQMNLTNQIIVGIRVKTQQCRLAGKQKLVL